MTLAAAAGLLACPVCAGALDLDDHGGGCVQGHRFDRARQGYLNLSGTAEPANADTADMLAARGRVHDSGLFDPVREALTHAVPTPARVVVEVGAGTAWYLRAAVGAGERRGIATDVSKAAARLAARADPRVASVVADTWRGLPIRTDVVDALLCVFAPRNPDEFARVLRPGGVAIVITPEADHLAELRQTYGLLDVPPDKATHLRARWAEHFDAESTQTVRTSQAVTSGLVADLIGMGPNAFHRDHARRVMAGQVTVAATVTAFRRR